MDILKIILKNIKIKIKIMYLLYYQVVNINNTKKHNNNFIKNQKNMYKCFLVLLIVMKI